jgi:hypothetical protein
VIAHLISALRWHAGGFAPVSTLSVIEEDLFPQLKCFLFKCHLFIVQHHTPALVQLKELPRDEGLCYLQIRHQLWTWEAEGFKYNFFEIIGYILFLRPIGYVTYFCLILGPSTLGFYSAMQTSVFERTWNLEENVVLSKIWINWTYILLLLRSRNNNAI